MARQAPRTVVIACGAIAHELVAVIKANQLVDIDIQCLPAEWHNTPQLIAPAVEEKIVSAHAQGASVLVAYGDCGTGGLLDKVLQEHNVERLPGAHCYSFFAGSNVFDAMAEAELGTFYLTDYLVDNFDRLILDGLGITRFPELKEQYFAHYTRLMYLMQNDASEHAAQRTLAAQRAAQTLGLTLQIHKTGLQSFEHSLLGIPVTTA